MKLECLFGEAKDIGVKPSLAVSWAEQAHQSHRPVLWPQAGQNKHAAETKRLLPSRNDLCGHLFGAVPLSVQLQTCFPCAEKEEVCNLMEIRA